MKLIGMDCFGRFLFLMRVYQMYGSDMYEALQEVVHVNTRCKVLLFTVCKVSLQLSYVY